MKITLKLTPAGTHLEIKKLIRKGVKVATIKMKCTPFHDIQLQNSMQNNIQA